MSFSTRSPFLFEGRNYYAAEELGFNNEGKCILELFSYLPENDDPPNYFTVLPISPKTFRRENRTKATFKIVGNLSIQVFDDWGNCYEFMFSNGQDFSLFVKDCIDAELVHV